MPAIQSVLYKLSTGYFCVSQQLCLMVYYRKTYQADEMVLTIYVPTCLNMWLNRELSSI